MIEVFLSKALICFSSMCFPALVGEATPIGEYEIIQRLVVSPGYGGDVMKFHEDSNGVYSIHRVWEGNPNEQRRKRLKMSSEYRRSISNGCINVSEEVYDALIEEIESGNNTISIKNS